MHNAVTDTRTFDIALAKAVAQEIGAVREQLNAVVDRAAAIARDEAAAGSPRYTGKKPRSYQGKNKPYADGWVVEGRSGYRIVCNKNKPRLTHLLNNGTVQRQTKKGYDRGYVLGDGHVDRAYERGVQHIEREIQNI